MNQEYIAPTNTKKDKILISEIAGLWTFFSHYQIKVNGYMMRSTKACTACTVLFLLWKRNSFNKQWKDHISAITLAFAIGMSLMSLKAYWKAAIILQM